MKWALAAILTLGVVTVVLMATRLLNDVLGSVLVAILLAMAFALSIVVRSRRRADSKR